jgi:hypothetical protein
MRVRRTACAQPLRRAVHRRAPPPVPQERSDLLSNAPHLAHPLPILMPCYKFWEVPFYWAGLKMYDLVAGGQAQSGPRRQPTALGPPAWAALVVAGMAASWQAAGCFGCRGASRGGAAAEGRPAACSSPMGAVDGMGTAAVRRRCPV